MLLPPQTGTCRDPQRRPSRDRRSGNVSTPFASHSTLPVPRLRATPPQWEYERGSKPGRSDAAHCPESLAYGPGMNTALPVGHTRHISQVSTKAVEVHPELCLVFVTRFAMSPSVKRFCSWGFTHRFIATSSCLLVLGVQAAEAWIKTNQEVQRCRSALI